jgi:hypothetical protein
MRVWIAIWTGSSIISNRVCTWIAGGPFARLLALLLATGFVKGLPFTTAIAGTAATGWLTTAITLGLRAPDPTAKSAPQAAGEAPPAEPEGPEQPTLPTRDDLATALHQVADPHAHLKAVAGALHTSTDRVREALTAAGIPITGGVRMGGRVSTGVRADHFPPLPSPSPDDPVAVVDAGQSNNNNADIVQDETNPHRWRVLRARA